MSTLQERTGDLLIEPVQKIAHETRLDPAVRAQQAAVDRMMPSAEMRSMLRGRWLAHPLHPLLSDFTEGLWMATTVVDLFGPRGTRPAARRLLGLGLLSAIPTALSGLAEYGTLRDDQQRRLGTAHTASSSIALGMYLLSYRSRRRGHQVRGALLALAGGVVAMADGYIAGDLAHAYGAGVRRTAGSIDLTEMPAL